MRNSAINRLFGRVHGWFECKEARVLGGALPASFGRGARLALVSLEDRTTPSTFTVLNIDDDGGVDPAASGILDGSDNGTGTLRQAIVNANANPGDDTIVFGSAFASAATVTLAAALPQITEAVTITGNQSAGVNVTTVSGNSLFPIFDTTPAAAATAITFDKLILTNGNSGAATAGGALTVGDENVTVSNSALNANTADQGGAVRVIGVGPFTISNSTLNNNSSTFTNATATSAGGGAIRSTTNSVININNSTFQANTANNDGGAIFGSGSLISISGSKLTLNRSLVINNTGTQGGGAIRVVGTSTLNIDQSTISSNTANNGGGAIFNSGSKVSVANSLIISNKAIANGSFAGRGGGIFNSGAAFSLTVTNSRVTGNSSGSVGGGFYGANATGVISITNSTIDTNTAASSGAGLMTFGVSSITISNSTFSSNSSNTTGGAIFTSSNVPTVLITNSTFTQNTSASGAGAIQLNAQAAGSSSTIRNSTITANRSNSGSSTPGAAAGGVSMNTAQTLNLISNIISGNSQTAGGGFSDLSMNASSTLIADFNAIGSTAGHTAVLTKSSLPTAGTNLDYGSALSLDVLADNGGALQGPTGSTAAGKTIGLLAGSAAVNTGSNPAALTTDQRGVTFPREIPTGQPDIGAFERTPGVPSATAAAPFTNVANANALAQDPYFFSVKYVGDSNLDVATLDNNDIRITGPNSFNSLATFVSSTPNTNNTQLIATYKLSAPVGGWSKTDNGIYTIAAEASQVSLVGGTFSVPQTTLGTFNVAISTTYTVTNTNDTGAGSLRQALVDANTNPTIASDFIVFDSSFSTAKTITLVNELPITDNVTITGPGANLLTVSGNDSVRIFNITNATAALDVNISGMTLTHGKTSGNGGAIFFFDEKLTLTEVNITANSAASGGAIGNNSTANAGGPLTIIRSSISGNSASSRGGAVMFYSSASSVFDLRNSTITGNTAATIGGAFYGFNWNSATHTLRVTNSTITDNSAGTSGGGIRVSGSATPIITVTSSIVSGNTAPTGPDFMNGTVNTKFSAIGSATGGTAGVGTTANDLPVGSVLGLLPLANNGGPTPTRSFTANSLLLNAGSNPNGDLYDQRGVGFTRTFAGLTDIGALERVPGPPTAVSTFVNVQADNPTTNPYAFSVVYTDDNGMDVSTIGDAGGKDILVTGPNGFSQYAQFVSIDDNTNGTPRTATYQIIPPGGTWDFGDNGNYTVTVQANEVFSIAPVTAVPVTVLGTFNVGFQGTYLVTNANDSGAGSLRQAILDSNISLNSADTILFDSAFFKGSTKTITLASPLPGFIDGVTITGPGASLATVSGAGLNRIFDVSPAPANTPFTISGLTLRDGSTASNGGAINIGDETVILSNLSLLNNQAVEGGAISIASTKASLTITGSILTGNSATGGDGGAINVGASDLTLLAIDTSTISGNSAQSDGGGVYFVDGGSFSLTRSTVSGNIASGTGPGASLGGGGIYFFGTIGSGGFLISNSTISGNTHTSLPGGGIVFASVDGGIPEISNSTIVGNKASNGGGIARNGGTGGLNITSSIVADNTTSGGAALDISFGIAIVSATKSAIGSDSEGSISDYTNPFFVNVPLGTPLQLGPLQSNGGPTQTIALLSGSPAIDTGTSAGLVVDQRGLNRDVGGVDIGAYELQATFVSGIVLSTTTINDASVGANNFTVTATFNTPMDQTIQPTVNFPVEPVVGTLTFSSGAWIDSTHWMAKYNVADNGITLPNIDLTISDGKDLLGNLQTPFEATNAFNIDTQNPVISSITSTTPNGTYTVGQTVNVTLNFSEAVILTGTLNVTLDTGAVVSIVGPVSGTSLSGTYTIVSGQSSPDLNVTAIALTGGSTLRDAATNNSVLSLPVSNLATNAAIVVANPTPAVTGFVVNGGDRQRSRITSVEVTFDANVNTNLAAYQALGAVTFTRTALPTRVTTAQVGDIIRSGETTSGVGIVNVTLGSANNKLLFTFDNTIAGLPGTSETKFVEYTSLTDGYWKFTVLGGTGSVTGDVQLRRLFGDKPADLPAPAYDPVIPGTINGADLDAFGQVFSSNSVAFDYDNNGTINGADLDAFGNRFSNSL